MMIYTLVFILIAYNFVNAATYSIAYFPANELPMTFKTVVDGFATQVTTAGSAQYYNFDYEIGKSLELFVLPSRDTYRGHFLIKNGPLGTGKTIYDSRAKTFFLVNQCPVDQQNCRLNIERVSLSGYTVDIYLNEELALENFSGVSTSIEVNTNDVIKVIVNGTPTSQLASLKFDTADLATNAPIGEILFWINGHLVTGAVIETVGITSPKDGATVLATPSGRRIDVKLSSTPLPAFYNVQADCGSFPPVSKLILSNTETEQSISIPADYNSLECSLSVIDTVSGVNTVIVRIGMSTVEINQFLSTLGYGSDYMSFDRLLQTQNSI